MPWEIDHVFFATSEPDGVQRGLTDLGIATTPQRKHAGQGTTNTCAMFENAYFELLWGHDREELRSDVVHPLGLDERIHSRETGACPIGICLHPTGADADAATWPFATWRYKPAYVTLGDGIPIVTPPRCLHEPLLFISTWPKRAGSGQQHRGTPRTLTGVGVSRSKADAQPSPGLRWLLAESSLVLVLNDEQLLLELEWDAGAQGEQHQLSGAPIRIRW